MRKCILVLGIRSGTSMVAGILQLMGVELGSPLIGAGRENPKGFFELEALVKLNERYVDWTRPAWMKLAKPDQFKKELKELIQKHFLQSPVFALKDPRITMLYPLYVEVLKELNIEFYLISVMRPFKAMVKSLRTYHNMTEEQAMNLIIRYLSLSAFYTKKYNPPRSTIGIPYEDILRYPTMACTELADFLGIDFQHNDEIREFVDEKLNRCGGKE